MTTMKRNGIACLTVKVSAASASQFVRKKRAIVSSSSVKPKGNARGPCDCGRITEIGWRVAPRIQRARSIGAAGSICQAKRARSATSSRRRRPQPKARSQLPRSADEVDGNRAKASIHRAAKAGVTILRSGKIKNPLSTSLSWSSRAEENKAASQGKPRDERRNQHHYPVGGAAPPYGVADEFHRLAIILPRDAATSADAIDRTMDRNRRILALRHPLKNSRGDEGSIRIRPLRRPVDPARRVAIKGRAARARIIDPAKSIDDRLVEPDEFRFELESSTARLFKYPEQGNIGKAVIGITATDIGVCSGEPDLPNAIGGDPVSLELVYLAEFVPDERVESRALVVKSERMPCAFDFVAKLAAAEAQRPDVVVDDAL